MKKRVPCPISLQRLQWMQELLQTRTLHSNLAVRHSPYLPSRFFRPYQMDESVSSFSILWHLIWVYTVCQGPKNGMLGKYGLKKRAVDTFSHQTTYAENINVLIFFFFFLFIPESFYLYYNIWKLKPHSLIFCCIQQCMIHWDFLDIKYKVKK